MFAQKGFSHCHLNLPLLSPLLAAAIADLSRGYLDHSINVPICAVFGIVETLAVPDFVDVVETAASPATHVGPKFAHLWRFRESNGR